MHVYRRQCDQTAWAFTVALLALLPVSYLALFEIEQELPLGDAGMTTFGLLPLLLLPFVMSARRWAEQGRAASRWAARSALRYALYVLAPVALLAPLPTLGTSYTGTPGSPLEEYFEVVLLAALLLGVPMLLALLMVAPWASARHQGARTALIVLSNLGPVFVLLLGGFPVLLVICAQVVFACRVTPTAAVTPRQDAG
ncbi:MULTISPECIES: hypothetical protein [unclassified Kitasatospora]|uniref:hypothetical protein n=1 Tax=unclassified Kitasatospora TaxID=2633591 RepID=UPI00070E499F|nr:MULTISPECIES: hypothetical protein [unclassified Kitasatospora]KQV14293.1 hypothetical protein ASC99_32010 [Kitasatospora sp. Root107]KRB72373.1 hypothetical protein ASE03_22895 [Kitasatospora sp. Root187]